jgi:hypothetical protein
VTGAAYEWSDAEIQTFLDPDLDDPAPQEEDEPEPQPAPQHTWVPIDLIAAALAPPDPPTIGGIVYPGRRHIFSGEPESLKTWATLCLEVEQIQKGCTVVHIDLEMGRRDIVERLRHLGATDQEVTDHFVYIEPSEAITADGVLEHVTNLIATRRPTLVVIDAFTGALAIHGWNPNSDVEIEAFYINVVDVLRRNGAAVVLLDHLPKDKENRGMYSIGSGRKVGATDVHLSFEIIQPFGRGKTGKAKLTVKKDRPGHLPRPKAAILQLVSDPETGAINFTWNAVEEEAQRTAEFRPTTLMEKISRYMEKHLEVASRNKIETDVQGSVKGKRMGLDILVREGYLTEEEGPNRTRITRFVKQYRAPAEGQKEQFVGSSNSTVRRTDEPPASSSPPEGPLVERGHQGTNLPGDERTNCDSPGSSTHPSERAALDAHHDSLFDPSGDAEYDGPWI